MNAKHIANIITLLRIPFSAALLFIAPFSTPFIIILLLSFATDIADGAIARALHTQSSFGAMLDSLCDYVFYACLIICSLPLIISKLTALCVYSIIGIILIKATALCIGLIKFNKLILLHTWLNKCSGVLVFLLLLLSTTSLYSYLIYITCIVCIIAATEEFLCIVLQKEPDTDIKSLYHALQSTKSHAQRY